MKVTECTVVKLGGSLLEDAALRAGALDAIAARRAAGDRVVVVHGGGKRIDAQLAARGIPRRTHGGLRVTDAPTLEVVVGVLAGLVNKLIVTELLARGVGAAGISGADAGTVAAAVHPPVDGVDLGFVGLPSGADPALALSLLDAGFVPVVASIAAGPDGALLNVNADAAAAALAPALGADRLVFLTDVEGLLDGAGALITRLSLAQAEVLLSAPFIGGGMRPKLGACISALNAGVPYVAIAGPSLHRTVLEDGKGGTILVAA